MEYSHVKSLLLFVQLVTEGSLTLLWDHPPSSAPHAEPRNVCPMLRSGFQDFKNLQETGDNRVGFPVPVAVDPLFDA